MEKIMNNAQKVAGNGKVGINNKINNFKKDFKNKNKKVMGKKPFTPKVEKPKTLIEKLYAYAYGCKIVFKIFLSGNVGDVKNPKRQDEIFAKLKYIIGKDKKKTYTLELYSGSNPSSELIGILKDKSITNVFIYPDTNVKFEIGDKFVVAESLTSVKRLSPTALLDPTIEY